MLSARCGTVAEKRRMNRKKGETKQAKERRGGSKKTERTSAIAKKETAKERTRMRMETYFTSFRCL